MPVRQWLEPFLGLRDRLLSDPRFVSLAVRFPLTRPIARRRARSVFDLVAGFVYSQVLLACVQLRLFEILREGPQPLTALAERLNLPPASAKCLLDAAASLGLTQERGESAFGLGPHGASLLANPGILSMIEHHAILYRDLADPIALLRGEMPETALSRYWAYARAAAPAQVAGEDVRDYTALMSASQTLVADEILDAYPIGAHKRLLDIGGGDGTFITRAAARAPDLQLMLFDLPAVAARANARFQEAGLASRAHALGGNFHEDALPKGADVATLVRIIHDHDDDAVEKLLTSVKAALNAGGTLLIAEPMSDTPGAEPIGAAYFGFYLMAMGSGRPRSAHTLTKMLMRAGFSRIRRIPTRMPLQTSLIIAQS